MSVFASGDEESEASLGIAAADEQISGNANAAINKSTTS